MTDIPGFMISRQFAMPRSKMWAAWTRPDQLQQWFGPKGWDNAILAFDFRPGGEWRGRMQMPDGSMMFSKFVFREIEEPSRLTWIHGFADEGGNRVRAPFAPQLPLDLLTTVRFTDEDEGTRIDLSWEPIDATAEEREFFASMMESMAGGWTGSFDQLEEFMKESV